MASLMPEPYPPHACCICNIEHVINTSPAALSLLCWVAARLLRPSRGGPPQLDANHLSRARGRYADSAAGLGAARQRMQPAPGGCLLQQVT
jgi:hypothetical protein